MSAPLSPHPLVFSHGFVVDYVIVQHQKFLDKASSMQFLTKAWVCATIGCMHVQARLLLVVLMRHAVRPLALCQQAPAAALWI